jgi:hypothetical protein
MDAGAREALLYRLVRDSDADPDSVEIVRDRQVGEHLTVLARWAEAQTGRQRRGAVDLVKRDGVWRASGGWSSNADHDADHPVWRAWGGGQGSMSGWVFDPAGTTVRLRDPDGRIEEDAVEDGVVILLYHAAFGRDSVVEVLDGNGTVLCAAPIERHQ